MTLSALNAICPIDSRYLNKTKALSAFFSEYALIYYRLRVEIRWLESLAANAQIAEVPALEASQQTFLTNLLKQFDEQEALKVKAFEKQTNHDVKAVEYYLRDKLEQSSLKGLSSFIHLRGIGIKR